MARCRRGNRAVVEPSWRGELIDPFFWAGMFALVLFKLLLGLILA